MTVEIYFVSDCHNFYCCCCYRDNTGDLMVDSGVDVELEKGSDALEDSLRMNKFGPSYMKNIKLVRKGSLFWKGLL